MNDLDLISKNTNCKQLFIEINDGKVEHRDDGVFLIAAKVHITFPMNITRLKDILNSEARRYNAFGYNYNLIP